MLPSDFSPAAQHPQQLFFPIRNNEATWLATEEKCPGSPGSSVFATVTKKKHRWTWISKHWRDMYYFWLLWKINWCSSLDTNRRKHISLLTFFFFSSPTGLEHNVILCMAACTASELLQCCWEEGLEMFMHYKTSIHPHFTCNVITEHKHRIARIKLEISNLFFLLPFWLTM